MVPMFLIGGLTGCSIPFAILVLVAIASMFLSVVIAAEDMPSSSQKAHISSSPISRCTSKHAAFVHHNAVVRTQLAYLPLRMSDDSSRIIARLDRQNEILSEPVNHLNKVEVSKHYACPPTSLESLRKRYGTRQSLWGEWSNAETRAFYRTQLPRALQIDGALGLTLAERAQLASEARHALRVYSRERCFLPGRLAARIYDGLRHFQLFGYWSCDGMNWTEVQEKYAKDARIQLGPDATPAEIEMFVYQKIVDRACATNAIFDHYASQGTIEHGQLLTLIKGIFVVEKLKSSRPRSAMKPEVIEELEKQIEDERALAVYARTVPFENGVSNSDAAAGCSMSMSLALPHQGAHYTASSDAFRQSMVVAAEKAERLIRQILLTAIGKTNSVSDQLLYLIESHVHSTPFN